MADAVKMLDTQLADHGAPGIEKPLPDSLCAASWLTEALPPPDPVLIDTLDMGGKCVVIGPSKSRKTFFMLQMAVSLAAGLHDFLEWEILKARRVLFINLEVMDYHMHRRLGFVCDSLKIEHGDLERLHIWNLRGHPIGLHRLEDLRARIDDLRAEVVLFDPLYKLHDGDENKAQDIKPVLAMFDQIAESSEVTVIYSHHDSKGSVSKRQTIDRGAGSNVLARDYDTAFYLAEHREEGLQVAQTITRAYPPQDAVSLCWENGAFQVSSEAPVLRSRNKPDHLGPKLTEKDALDVVIAGPMAKTMYHEQLRKAGFTDREARATRDDLISRGVLSEHKERKFQGITWIGLPEHIRAKKEEVEK